MDAVNDHVGEGVVVPVEEDLDSVILHELVHQRLLANIGG
jgi:hypothetical protein